MPSLSWRSPAWPSPRARRDIFLALSSVTMMSPCCSAAALSSMVFSASDQVCPAALQAQDGLNSGRISERVRQRRIGLAADRHRLVHVLAGIAIGEQRGFRRRAQRLAGLLVVGEARRHGGERDREIGAVAGADADRAIGAGLRADIGTRRRIRSVVVAEQVVQEIAGAAAARGIGILRPAIVLRERHQHRAALIVAIGAAEAAAAQPLEAGGDLIEIGAHLLDLVVDRTALRGLAVRTARRIRSCRSPSAWPARSRDRVRPAAWWRHPGSAGSGRPWRDRRCRRGRWSPVALPAAGTSD